MAPYVETIAEVKEIVGAVHYRPIKGQLLREFLDGTRVPSQKTSSFLKRFNRHCYAIIGVESVAAYENLDAILGVEGLDGIFIGPHDLSVSLEAPEEWTNPEFRRIIEDTVRRCRAAGVGIGVHITPWIVPDAWLRQLMGMGMNWILYAADTVMAKLALQSRIEELRGEYADVKEVPRSVKRPDISSCIAPPKEVGERKGVAAAPRKH